MKYTKNRQLKHTHQNDKLIVFCIISYRKGTNCLFKVLMCRFFGTPRNKNNIHREVQMTDYQLLVQIYTETFALSRTVDSS